MLTYRSKTCLGLLSLTVTMALAACAQPAPMTTPTDAQAAEVSIVGPGTPSAGQSEEPSEPVAASSQVAAKDLLAADLATPPDTMEQALYWGQYGNAIAMWEANHPDLAQSGLMAIELVHAYIAEDRPRDAVALLIDLVAANREPDVQAAALGLLGGLYADLGEWTESIAAYSRHLSITQAVAPQVMMRVTSAYLALGDEQGALHVLENIDLDALDAADRAGALEDRAELLRKTGHPDEALELYQQILGFARQTGYRALVRHYYAQTLVEAGRTEDALAAWRGILRDAPESYTAILALDALDLHDAAGLNNLERAQVLLKAGRLDAADQALQAHMSGQPNEMLAQALLLQGDLHVARSEFGAALAVYDKIIGDLADSDQAAEAWFAKAAAEKAQGGDPTSQYYEFSRLYPEHGRAAEALWLAGQYQERKGAWDSAQRLYGLIVERYPESDQSPEAGFRQALMLYADGRYNEAGDIWAQGPPDETTEDEARARWHLWQGLAYDKAGEDPRPAWTQAYETGPLTYYGLRADELARAINDTGGKQRTLALTGVALSPKAASAIDAWISSWYTGTLQQEIAEVIDTAAETALLMDRMGWHADAMRLMRDHYETFKPDPLAELRLAQRCLEQGWYSPMILAANRTRWLGRDAGAEDAPNALWRLSYPIVYPTLLATYADQYGLDPLLLLALMRQESRFDAQAVSYAGAKGLAQVMPDTGEWIAERLGAANYRTSWLERPHVSMAYGAWFMRWLLDLYDNDTVAALTAYNAGPGTVNRWTGEQPITDHDQFIETMPLQQPHDYVTWISIQYRMYQRLYTAQE